MKMEVGCSEVFGKKEIIKPYFTTEDAPNLAKKVFGIWVTSVKELNGYDDKNFLLEVSRTENPFLEDVTNKKFVLKVLNSKDSQNEQMIEAQNEVMAHLSESNLGVVVPKPLRNLEGKYNAIETYEEKEDAENDRKHIIRLFEYIPGRLMKDVVYSKELCYEVGKLTGTLCNNLKKFESNLLKEGKYLWKLESLPVLRDYLFVITEETKLDVLKEVLSAWDDFVAPLISTLEKGIIHGDLNEQNILIDVTSKPRYPFHHIFGVLDFGDVNWSPLIFDLCIAVTYVMIEVEVLDPIEASGYVIAGYSSERDISDTELSIFKECIAARLAQSLILGAYSYLHDADNVYLLCTAKTGWKRLFNLWRMPKDELIKKWKNCIQSFHI